MATKAFTKDELAYYAKGIEDKEIEEVVITDVVANEEGARYYHKTLFGTHVLRGELLFKTLKEAKDKTNENKRAFIEKVEEEIQTPQEAASFMWWTQLRYLNDTIRGIYKDRIEEVLSVKLD